MALRATSHGDLQALSLPAKPGASDSGFFRSSFSLGNSSSNVHHNGTGGGRFFGKEGGGGGGGGGGVVEELRGFQKPFRRPVRAVRPVSALGGSGSFLQINHLQGELVRKRKECEDLKKENKYLSGEIHMERIMMRTENELTMRNLRNLNQELLAQVKEVKQKLYLSQQRATLFSRAAEEAEASRGQAEKVRALAEARALGSRQDRDQAEADRTRLDQDLQLLKKQHTELQLLLVQTERNYFEAKLQLDRVSAEKLSLLEETRRLGGDRTVLRQQLGQLTEDNVNVKEKEVISRRRAVEAEEQGEQAARRQQEAERGRSLAERGRQERTEEALSWREKHQGLADLLRAQDDLRAQRQNKACQANIKSYFLCMTESDQRVKILKNQDGTPRNFTEGDPVYISTPEPGGAEDADSRSMLRVSAPRAGKDLGPSHFGDLSPMGGGETPETGPPRRSRKVVDYFWIPTDEE